MVQNALPAVFKDRWSFTSYKFDPFIFDQGSHIYSLYTPFVCGFDLSNNNVLLVIVNNKLIYRLSFIRNKTTACTVISCTPLV